MIRGSGESTQGGDVITWDEGDAFCLPGGGETAHVAAGDSLLYVVTNEPMLAFERLQPPAAGRAPIEAAHFPADEIDRQLERIHAMAMTAEMPGKSISFGTAGRGPSTSRCPPSPSRSTRCRPARCSGRTNTMRWR